MGTVPAGKVWELRYLQLQHAAATGGCQATIDGVDAATGAAVPLMRVQGPTPQSVVAAVVPNKLNAGDSVRVRCTAVPPVTAFVSYIER